MTFVQLARGHKPKLEKEREKTFQEDKIDRIPDISGFIKKGF